MGIHKEQSNKKGAKKSSSFGVKAVISFTSVGIKKIDLMTSQKSGIFWEVGKGGRFIDDQTYILINQWFQAFPNGDHSSLPLDWEGISPYSRKVLPFLAQIPPGETRSYKEIAEAVGQPKAARAIGMVCAKNPWPLLFPCHRVIASNGSLTGFAFGLSLKKHLLTLESSH